MAIITIVLNALSFILWVVWVAIGTELVRATYQDYKKGEKADFGITFAEPDITLIAYLLLTVVIAQMTYFVNSPL